MSSSGSEKASKGLFDTASTFVQLGFSIIPVYGDRDAAQAKVASIDWKPFQSRYATHTELYEWFFKRQYQGLAIVTGKVSRLVVFDFDDSAMADAFMRRFPALCETRIVHSATRNLPHIYFRLPVGVTMPSRRLPGLDVQSDGRYIVSPPTVLSGAEYRVLRGGLPRQLTRSEVDQLLQYVDELARIQPSDEQSVVASAAVRMRTPDECLNHYLAVAKYAGRNHALFRTALLMRDCGWHHEDTLALLQPLHVSMIRASERPAQREKEAIATVRSAYSRPPRQEKESSTGLPNSLREKLLSLNKVALLRVLDGLAIAGVPTGALLTEKEIADHLKGIVGRYSILQALSETLGENRVFQRSHPFPRPHTHTNVATDTNCIEEKNCLQMGVTASDRNRGRPAMRYQMPCLNDLCAAVGVRYTASDPLDADDLRTPSRYRQGLHRELIKRRPGSYHVQLLARRLNVAERTCQRYNRACGINLLPTFERYPIHAGLMHVLNAPRPGMFIEDVRGRRYPCLPEIAQRLLAAGAYPRLCVQGFNHYTHPDGRYSAVGLAVEVPKAAQEPHSAFFVPAECSAKVAIADTPSAPALMLPRKPQTVVVPRLNPRTFRRALVDVGLEAAAMRLYHHVCDLVEQAPEKSIGKLSMATARRLAVQYGASLLVRCQNVIHTRTNIDNYAGFIVSFLRSESTTQRLVNNLS